VNYIKLKGQDQAIFEEFIMAYKKVIYLALEKIVHSRVRIQMHQLMTIAKKIMDDFGNLQVN